ncbi:MAG: hypothetical protein NC122_04715 [Faecalibacterium sp.]|nr:hypothetical protein [Ruminococcus sp.]MCM1391550.1 hypothetical protein [Ruminococcus sp.]MCM1485487.1 hypothetical protein [Faecalibacterium sp.]
MKRLFDKFCIAVTVIAAVTIILCGKVTAEQQGEKIMQGTEYKSVMLESSDNTITVQVDESDFTFNKSLLNSMSKYKRYISLTPFGTIAYFVDCVNELIK